MEPASANWIETGHKNHTGTHSYTDVMMIMMRMRMTRERGEKKRIEANPVFMRCSTYKWPIRQTHRNAIIYEHDMTHAVALYPLFCSY